MLLLVAAHADRRLETKKLENSDAFFGSGTQTFYFCRSLDYARDSKSIIYVSTIYAPIYTLSRSKALKCRKFSVTNVREKPADFSYSTTQASTLAPKIILQTWVPLRKFAFL